jgi:hypothetical protein
MHFRDRTPNFEQGVGHGKLSRWWEFRGSRVIPSSIPAACHTRPGLGSGNLEGYTGNIYSIYQQNRTRCGSHVQPNMALPYLRLHVVDIVMIFPTAVIQSTHQRMWRYASLTKATQQNPFAQNCCTFSESCCTPELAWHLVICRCHDACTHQ